MADLLGCSALLLLSLVVPCGLLLLMVGLPPDQDPASEHLDAVDRAAFLEVTERLMNDVDRHGAYVDDARFEAATQTYGYFARHERFDEDGPEAVEALPELLQSMEPIEVLVDGGSVTLTWHARGYGYGYELLRLRHANGSTAQRLRQHDGEFQRNVEIAPGLWSRFPFH